MAGTLPASPDGAVPCRRSSSRRSRPTSRALRRGAGPRPYCRQRPLQAGRSSPRERRGRYRAQQAGKHAGKRKRVSHCGFPCGNVLSKAVAGGSGPAGSTVRASLRLRMRLASSSPRNSSLTGLSTARDLHMRDAAEEETIVDCADGDVAIRPAASANGVVPVGMMPPHGAFRIVAR